MLKKILLLIIVFCSLIISPQLIRAQIAPPDVKSIPLPTGSGARALGQGGAFIAVADDATAASWNPAGLIQLERPEASIVGSYMMTDQDFSSDPGTGITIGDEDVSRSDVNFLSFAYPFRFLKKNIVAAINYHQIYDFHNDLSFNFSLDDPTPPPLSLDQKLSFKSSGGIGALSPGIAILLTPKVTVGLTVNIFDDEFFGSHGWTETVETSLTGEFDGVPISSISRTKTSSSDYHGANVTIGGLWDMWEKEDKLLTFGAVYHSAYTARFDQEINGFSETTQQGLAPTRFVFNQNSRIKMDWPMSFGVGLGFRYTDALSFSFDVAWTDWSEWKQKTKVTGSPQTAKSRPIGGGSEHDEIDDTVAVRFGTEYLMFRAKEVIALRGGLFYEPRPSLGDVRDVDANGNPVDFNGNPTDVWGFSFGTGLSTKRYSLDAAYQFRFVRDMEGRDMGLSGTKIDTVENMFLTSLIVYF